MKFFYILLISIACLTLTGCGGSGGGDNGIILSPQQQEFADIVYAFATAVNSKDKVRAMDLVSTDMLYNTQYDYSYFKSRLDDFLDNAEEVNFQINGLGVSFIKEDEEAEIRANITFSYKIVGVENTLSETVEIYVKKYGSLKGISLFQKYRNEISAFPPVLE